MTPKQQAIQDAVASIRQIVKDMDIADVVGEQCDVIDQNGWGVTLGDVVKGTAAPNEPNVVALEDPTVPESLVPIPAPVTTDRMPVISGFLAAIGYDPATKRLEAEFKTGHLWAVADVEPEQYTEFMAQGENMGGYFNRYLRPRMVEVRQ